MPFSLIPFMLLIIPMLEIATFVVIGGQIGVFPTLGMIVVTAIIGTILLRVQGFGLIRKIQSDIDGGKMPARELVHGVMIAIAGILLLTPGFVTDTCGFLLFVPPIRDAVWQFAKSRINIVNVSSNRTQNPGGGGDGDSPTIDLDDADFKREPDADSPWYDK